MLLEMRDVKKEKSIGAEKYDCMLNSGKKKNGHLFDSKDSSVLGTKHKTFGME